jgi:hypothetical protein
MSRHFMGSAAMFRMLHVLFALTAGLLFAPFVAAQDLYDPTVLRTFELQFHDANWEARLRQNYESEQLILADLTVEGVTYPNVGVRIRGNTSYRLLPRGSQKFSLKIETDFVDPEQTLMGYDSINLNNGFQDPTFSREVVYNNFVAQYIPNIRANNVVVRLNGQNWGVYNNVQQGNKSMLRRYFPNPDGVRITCSNEPNGPGLAYAGNNPSSYGVYEVSNDGGVADPISSVLIPVTKLLSTTNASNWQATDARFAIDPSIWSVVLENAFGDDDGYVRKGCDFATYTDPLDNRMHLIQRDGNEVMNITLAPTASFTATNKPFLSRVIAGVPELRQRYFAHYRTIKPHINWETFGVMLAANRALIEEAVQQDPKRLYSIENFHDGFGDDRVELTAADGSTPPGNDGFGYLPVMGLEQFFNQRVASFRNVAELNASGPMIESLAANSDTPAAGDPVHITAKVTPAANSAVAKVELFYRVGSSSPYQRVLMQDDGASGDAAAGDDVYGVELPVVGAEGEVVSYYVAATSNDTFSSLSFLPKLAERGPRRLEFQLAVTPGMRITEWMYSGESGEYIEFTNVSEQPIDMTDWSVDDDHAVADAFSLSSFGVVQPGESVLVTEVPAEQFRSEWGIANSVKIIGDLGAKGVGGNNLGRSDQINLYNNKGGLIDRLTYGDQIFAGSPRTQNASGQATCKVIGLDNVVMWTLSFIGDGFGSIKAQRSNDIGTPGRFAGGACSSSSDRLFADGFEIVN